MVKLDRKKISVAMNLQGVADYSDLAHRAGVAVVSAETALKGGAVNGSDAYKIAFALGVPESDLVVGKLDDGRGKWHKVTPTDDLGACLTDKLNQSAAFIIGFVNEERKDLAQHILHNIISCAGALARLN